MNASAKFVNMQWKMCKLSFFKDYNVLKNKYYIRNEACLKSILIARKKIK